VPVRKAKPVDDGSLRVVFVALTALSVSWIAIGLILVVKLIRRGPYSLMTTWSAKLTEKLLSDDRIFYKTYGFLGWGMVVAGGIGLTCIFLLARVAVEVANEVRVPLGFAAVLVPLLVAHILARIYLGRL